MKTIKTMKSPAPIRFIVGAPARTKIGELPTIKEMMTPLVQPLGLIKSRTAAGR